MKWIGQHIYDFVSRFKSDIYIEEDDRFFHFDISAAELEINSGAGNGPYLQLKNEDSDSNPAYLQFFKYGDNGTAGDDIGVINFWSKLDNGNTLTYAQVLGEISDPSNAGAEGKISISTKAHNTPYGNVITGEGNGDGVVDVTLALGASSTTTIAGDLSVTTGLILDSVDITTIQTSAESFADNDTSLMTSAAIDDRIVAATSSTFVDLTSEVSGTLPVANGGTGATSLTDNKLLTGTGTSAVTAEANATYDGTDLTLTSATSTKPILSIENTTNDVNAGELKLIGRRSADASVIAANGDDTGKITFVGENNKSGPDPETITYSQILGETSSTVDGAEHGKISIKVAETGSLSDFVTAYASGLGSVITFGNGGLLSTNEFQGTITNFTSSVSTGPIFGVYNYTNDATGPQFTIGNLRGGIAGGKTDGSDSDSCGTINFAAYDDGTPTQTTFAKIEGIAKDVSNGAEEGKLTLNVASHDGEIQPGLTVESGDAEDEVDVTIGNGSASVVTVPGFISIGGHAINDIDVAGEFVDSDEHLMTAAAINDQFGGGGGGVTADPFSTTVIKVLPNQWIINDDAGRPLFVEDDTSNTLGVRCFTTTDEMYAWQKLPSGYKATHVQVHASASTSSAVSVRSYNYQTGADNAVSATTGDLNANIDITDIPSSATQDLVIKVSPASGSTIVYGATVTIATI